MATVSSTTSTTALISSSLSSSTAAATSSTSDIDWNALITLAVDAKLTKADSVDLKITANETKIAAYTEMQTLLTGVTTAAQKLRAASGTSLASSNVFLGRAAYLTANGSVDAASSLAVTVETGAELGNHDVTISQLAKAHKLAGTAQTSKTTDLALDGVLSIGTGANLASVTITADMSLAEIAEAVNAVSGTSGVQASVLGVSSSDYRLVLTATETGLPITAASTYGDDVLQTLGLTDADGGFANVLQVAQAAIFTVDGITLTRTSNDVSDVLSGVTLHLYQTTAADTSIGVEVGTDLGAVKEAVVAVVDAYNAYRDFAYAQQQIPTSDNTDTTSLFGDGTLRNVNAAMAQAITTSIGAAGMALLGLSLDSTNRLELDETVLDSALLTDLDAIKDLLTFQMTSSSTSLMLLARGTKDIGDFDLNVVTDSSGALVSADIGGDASLFTISGTRIIGAAGSKYEGFSFVYAGSTSQTISVSTQTGIAELLYNTANGAANASSGTLATLITELGDYNNTLQAKSDTIREQAETYQTNLTNRYAQYQAAIEAAEASLDYLTTLIDTWNSSS
ncbi:flagellar hook-associated protein 2 [Devosia sp. YR412]|uniref:flagellar filament capping protein FliD n=1 Tax=Devosia sp. YR412 TaxID=1881030 RepID=UPI0008CDEA56|nr:flagellar filament capping protein FliD [Devosia sp. YR412]SEQ52396.1 flagellar hook-associated protein 2 [Devosia sp. YR412]